MKKFDIGKTYSMRSLGDQNCIWTYTVISRTAKTVTITDGKKPKSSKSTRAFPHIATPKQFSRWGGTQWPPAFTHNRRPGQG